MYDLIRSFSLRFYLSFCFGVAVFTAVLWQYDWLVAWLARGLVAILFSLFVVIPVLSLSFGLAYSFLGLVWPKLKWRNDRLVFEDAPSINIRSGPYWANEGRKPSVGTLAQFIEQNRSVTDDTELRIGIVLSGGGAKGVYQAGALTALWEFLERENALKYVKAITATSIGCWNAMFWLTDRVGNNDIRDWWASAAPGKIVGPTLYRPFFQNYVLSNQPWQRQFEVLFNTKSQTCLTQGPPFFYFTRTNASKARLELVTNHSITDQYWRLRNGKYERAGTIVDRQQGYLRAESIEAIKNAVFSSMDIPPAFKRMRSSEGDQLEDGGVIDNLPIRFATRFEGCNLLFVFPLNATFETEVSNRSIIKRTLRVMEIRQGVLERDAIKGIGLYNDLIATGQPNNRNMHSKGVTTFCICPKPPLDVNTFEFWKTRSRGPAAHSLMYEATKQLLDRFDFSITNDEVWMAQVNRNGEVSYKDFTGR